MSVVLGICTAIAWILASGTTVAAFIPSQTGRLVAFVAVPSALGLFTFYANLLGLPTSINYVFLLLPFAPLALRTLRGRGARSSLAHGFTSGPIPLLALLLSLIACLYVSVLFLFGSSAGFSDTASTRFTGLLSDNQLPHLLAEGVRKRDIPVPLLGDWNSADRPPLQAGVNLMMAPLLSWVPGLDVRTADQISGFCLQLLWVPAVMALVAVVGAPRRVMVASVLALAFTGSAFINTTYVWPKAVAAALVACAVAVVWNVGSKPRGASWLASGVLWGLAINAHGTAAFALLGALPLLLGLATRSPEPRDRSRRQLAPIRWVNEAVVPATLCALGAVLLYIPWQVYARARGESNDRLLKWMLAGQTEPTAQTTVDAVLGAYHGLSVDQWLISRWENIRALLPLPLDELHYELVDQIHNFEGFRFLGAIAWAAVWPTAYLSFGRRSNSSFGPAGIRFLRDMSVWTVTSLVVWVLVIFIPGLTTMNTGPLIVVMVPMVLCGYLLSTVAPRVAAIVLTFQLLAFVWLSFTISSAAVSTHVAASRGEPVHPGWLGMLLATALAFCLVVRRYVWTTERVQFPRMLTEATAPAQSMNKE